MGVDESAGPRVTSSPTRRSGEDVTRVVQVVGGDGPKAQRPKAACQCEALAAGPIRPGQPELTNRPEGRVGDLGLQFDYHSMVPQVNAFPASA